MGTGFMKCMPITLSGLLVTEAIFVIEIDDVFDARIVSGRVFSSISRNIFSLRSTFSVAASTTSCASFTPSFRNVVAVMLASAWSLASFVSVPFST